MLPVFRYDVRRVFGALRKRGSAHFASEAKRPANTFAAVIFSRAVRVLANSRCLQAMAFSPLAVPWASPPRGGVLGDPVRQRGEAIASRLPGTVIRGRETTSGEITLTCLNESRRL